MRWILLLYLLCLLGFVQKIHGQEKTVYFSGHFENAPFSEFADSLQSQAGVTVYYRNEWVKNISLTISGTHLPLQPLLDSLLQKEHLKYFVDEWEHLFITDTTQILTELPEYESQLVNKLSDSSEVEDQQLSSTEQNYFNGRKIMEPETFHVGSETQLAPGKKAMVSGRITDFDSGEPVIGATVYVEETKQGTSCNAEGRFQLSILPGKYQVECASVGMEPLLITMIVHSGGDLSLSMKKTLIPLDEVVVKSNRFNNVKGVQMGFESLKYKVFKEIPLVMGEKDIINVIKMLPGVQSTGEGSSGFNVRGSGADQNMVSINKVPVYNPSHLFGFFTSFSPEIVADFNLYKSNLPASFGGRLASFTDITSKQGNMKRFSARGGISAVSAYAAVEVPVVKDKSSLILSGRSTYSDWILRRFQDPVIRDSKAGFYDFSSVYTHILDEKTRFRIFGYLSQDHFDLGTTNSYDYGNSGASVDLSRRFNQHLSANFALINSRYHFTTSDVNQPSLGYKQGYILNHSEIKTDFDWLFRDQHRMTFGASIIDYHLDRGTIEPFGSSSIRVPMTLGKENGIEAAGYFGDELTLNNKLSVYAGLRISSFFSMGPAAVRKYVLGMPMLIENLAEEVQIGKGEISKAYYGLEPRFNVRYMLRDNSSLKFSYNRSKQYLFMLSNTISVAPTDQWKLADYNIRPESLDQTSLGYYKDFSEKGISTSVETYYKWGHHILDYRDGANLTESLYVENETLQGKQKSYGIETMIRKNSGMLNGWITYTYARSFMQISNPNPVEQINNGKVFPSNYDRPHNFTMVANIKRGRRVSYSTNLVYMTGRPVTYPVSVYYEHGLPYIQYSDRNKYRLPDYFRIDLSMNIEGNLKRNKLFHSFWMINVYNLTGRKNAYSVYFKNLDGHLQGYKLSIFAQPIVTVSWNIKLGNYASE